MENEIGREGYEPDWDDVDLIAAALGLKSSAWARAVVHLTKPEFNAAINGEQVLKDGEPVDDETDDNSQG